MARASVNFDAKNEASVSVKIVLPLGIMTYSGCASTDREPCKVNCGISTVGRATLYMDSAFLGISICFRGGYLSGFCIFFG